MITIRTSENLSEPGLIGLEATLTLENSRFPLVKRLRFEMKSDVLSAGAVADSRIF